ncbi:MAG: sugar phosphate nucleotidyltransferase [Acidobacteriota bacterium]
MIDLSEWPALVLAAGLGTRLRPLSLIRAKAALPVGDQPLIGRVLTWLRAAGLRRVVINLHHRPETITSLVGDGSPWDVHVRYSWEPVVMGSAGGPRRALPLLGSDRFLIINGDTLTDCDLASLVAQHVASQARVTMAVTAGDVGRYGGVLVRPDDVVTGFSHAGAPPAERPGVASRAAATPWHFIGVQAANREAFADLPDDAPSETMRTVYPRLIADHPGAIRAFKSGAGFLDIGTPADYLRTVAEVIARERRPLGRGQGCLVDASARLTGTILWDRVTIGRRAVLTDCIVADDVRVPDEACYERSVLAVVGGVLRIQRF